MFAIPASMLTWGFEAEAERLAAKARRRALRRLQGRRRASDSTLSSCSTTSSSSESEWSSSSVDTSDEEYQKIIAGGDVEEETAGGGTNNNDEDMAMVKELVEMFQQADADASDSLSQEEFVELVMRTLRGRSQRHMGGGGGGNTTTTSASISTTGTRTMGASATDAASLTSRISQLEAKVDAMSDKLDRVLLSLEASKGTRR